jgi:catechol 2,3-dioxygenase-like lactoylglutathione lyase family enzyme
MAGAPGLGPIGQVSREVGDIAAAEAFYGQTLGLPHLYTYGKLAFFDCGGLRLYLQEAPPPVRPQACLYFMVGDIEAAHRELVARGVSFREPPHLVHRHPDGVEEWMGFFDDPDGNVLALMSKRQG